MTYRYTTLLGAALSCWALSSSAETPDLNELTACLDEPDRLDRLYCYDEAMGRPDLHDRTGEIPVVVETRSAELQAFDAVMSSPDVTESGVPIIVRDAVTQDYVFEPGLETVDMLREWAVSEDHATLVQQNNVFIATRSDSELGSDGGVIVSCESNITHVRFVWDKPFDERLVKVRILAGPTIQTANAVIEQTLRASPDRYYLNAPRGLSGIALLRELSRSPIAQVSVGEGETHRSLFFDMRPLNSALGYIGQHCGWSDVPSRGTNQ